MVMGNTLTYFSLFGKLLVSSKLNSYGSVLYVNGKWLEVWYNLFSSRSLSDSGWVGKIVTVSTNCTVLHCHNIRHYNDCCRIIFQCSFFFSFPYSSNLKQSNPFILFSHFICLKGLRSALSTVPILMLHLGLCCSICLVCW